MKETIVRSKTVKQAIEASPFAVQAIDLKKDYNKGGDISEVLNRASGVKIRTDGSIGAPVQINLGGLQGKAVRLFRDGIPVELFGHGFSLGTIPANMLDRIEIYKGVMPLYLASDALGGGVNLVSRHEYKNQAEISYERGSFNTHRATLYGIWNDPAKKWYVGTNSSFNYSDNNYKVEAPFIDTETSVTSYRNVRRFHDATRTLYVEGFAGLQNRAWADDLRLTVLGSGFYKELQHDILMNKVNGQALSKEKNYTGLLNYKKNFFDERLKVSLLSTYSFFKTRFIDTATVRYGWDGSIIGTGLTPGEINGGNDQRLDYRFFSARLNVSYALSHKHTVDFSELFHHQNRKGSDPLGSISPVENIDVLTVPAFYRKDVMALGLRSTWFDDRVESIVALKYYHFNTKGFTTDNSGTGWRSANDTSRIGYLAGLRWTKGRFLTKVSYEYATRLPDEIEIFGDGVLSKENMDLQPEKSHNVNLNARYSIINGDNRLTLSADLFFRKVKDGIFLQKDIPYNRYINFEHSEIKGFEFEASYATGKRFDLGANFTYQDIRRINIEDALFKIEEGSRVPNIPFLFGNFWLNQGFKGVFNRADRMEINWNANYTHRFFLHTIPKGNEPALFGKVEDFQSSLIIPADGRLGLFSNNAGVYYHFPNQKISLSGECRNIGNVKLYDNFSVQKPGRSFHVKLVYHIF
nr:TonB-dependent receptor plug domain-containing protein [Pedobacter xinjiangensis]